MSNCKEWVIPSEPIMIGYGHQKRTLREKIRKVKNTILARWAYACPSNGLRVRLHRWRGCHIGDNVYIGMYCIFDNLAPEYIYIMDNAAVNANNMILTHFNPVNHLNKMFEAQIKPVVIKERAMVAVRCTILPGVTIGENAIVSAGMVIDKDVPDYTMVREKQKRQEVDMKFLFK